MPDFLFYWCLWWLNFWHAHPICWWVVVVLAFGFNFAAAVRRQRS